jgi:hypothetical protein
LFDLYPVLGDVFEVLCVLVDLLEEGPLFLDLSEILLGLVLLATFSGGHTLFSPYLSYGSGALWQALYGLYGLSAEALVLVFEADQSLSLMLWRSVGRAIWPSGEIGQAGIAVLVPSTQPLSDGVTGGVKISGGRSYATFQGFLDHEVAQVPYVFTCSHNRVVCIWAHEMTSLLIGVDEEVILRHWRSCVHFLSNPPFSLCPAAF